MLWVNDDAESLRDARATIDSLTRQAYPNWRLLIVPQGPGNKSAAIRDRLLAATPGLDDRAELTRNLTPRILDGIASGAQAGGVFVTVLSPRDQLGAETVLEMAVAAGMHVEADVFLHHPPS